MCQDPARMHESTMRQFQSICSPLAAMSGMLHGERPSYVHLAFASAQDGGIGTVVVRHGGRVLGGGNRGGTVSTFWFNNGLLMRAHRLPGPRRYTYYHEQCARLRPRWPSPNVSRASKTLRVLKQWGNLLKRERTCRKSHKWHLPPRPPAGQKLGIAHFVSHHDET